MSQKWRKYSPEFRTQALEKMKHSTNISQLARELGIRRKLLYRWKKAAMAGLQEEDPPEPASSAASVRQLHHRIAQLEALAARQSLELDFFKAALQRVEERRRQRERTTGPGSGSKSGS